MRRTTLISKSLGSCGTTRLATLTTPLGKPFPKPSSPIAFRDIAGGLSWQGQPLRSEEHTSELQSRLHLVCRLLLEKKKPIRLPLYQSYRRLQLLDEMM